ncbi:MAG: ribonuclease E activity regulator RraA [Ignavibacteria bacterium]|nr:ribonuclease E activity regulator RraA [Ignavibacteria bacterium]
MKVSTADLCDEFAGSLKVASPAGFRDFGGKKSFSGEIATVKCHETNPKIRQVLETDGTGKVLVVDGGGSERCALMGDNMAELAIKNNWEGIVIYGSIRDSSAISRLNIGVKALNVNPVKSGKKNEGETNITVSFANTEFIPGQFIYCDDDGIVVSKEKLI